MSGATRTATPLPFVAIMLLGVAGCVSGPAVNLPDPEVRARFGRMDIRSISEPERFVVGLPPDKATVAERVFDNAQGGGGPGAIVGVVLTPLIAAAGAAYANVAVEPEQSAKSNVDTLRVAAASLRFDELLERKIVAYAAEKKLDYFARHPGFTSASAWEPLPPGSSRRQHDRFSAPLDKSSFDSGLRIRTIEPGLHTDGGAAGLRLRIGVSVQVKSDWEGSELYYTCHGFTGPRKSTTEWATDNGRLFRAEVERCARLLAEEIVDQMLIRTAPDSAAARR